MISNFHQSSGPYETSHQSSSYYTFDEPKATKPSKNKKPKKKGRIFGLGKPKQRKSAELGDWRPPQQQLDDSNSTLTGGQSLTYSTSAASYQTTGESTDSSGGAFGEILKMLDEEDRREMLEKRNHQRSTSDRSMYSTTSSLAYSEGTTTLNYSEDGDQSYLEGTKLLGMLSDSPSPEPQILAGARKETNDYVMSSPSPNKTPVVDNKTRSHYNDDNGSSRSRRTRDHSLRRDERRTAMVEDEDPVSSSSSSSNRWLCGIDLSDAGAALRPFLCF